MCRQMSAQSEKTAQRPDIYKKSRFNYVCAFPGGVLIYNTLYNSLTRLTAQEYEQYLCRDSADEGTGLQFFRQGILVEEGTEELGAYGQYIRLAAEHLQMRPNITVTPTMECNAVCFYCYEAGVRSGRMRTKDAARIVRAIKTLDCSRGVDLTWFGGEPLMNQEWMDVLSDCLRAEQIEFCAFLISNGSKIDDAVIARMRTAWNVRSVQITLDGCFEEHARRKAYIDQDDTVYYRTLRQTAMLSKAGILVQLRMNTDRANAQSILDAVADIAQLFQKDERVSCYPAFLTGTSEPFSEREKIDFVKKMIAVGEGKVRVNEYLYKLPRTVACYYYQQNAFSIDAQGNVFCCEHMLGHADSSLGNVREDLDLSRLPREAAPEREACMGCVFLPKCLGGCADALSSGEEPCFIDRYIIQAYLELLGGV